MENPGSAAVPLDRTVRALPPRGIYIPHSPALARHGRLSFCSIRNTCDVCARLLRLYGLLRYDAQTHAHTRTCVHVSRFLAFARRRRLPDIGVNFTSRNIDARARTAHTTAAAAARKAHD